MENAKHKLLNVVLGILLPAAVTTILLFPLLVKSGYIVHGDAGWYLFSSIPVILKYMIYTWNEGPLTAGGFFYMALELPLLLFGSYFANHALTFLLAFLPGVTSYFSIYKILNIIYADKRNAWKYIATSVGSVFYLVNWQNYGLTNPTLSWAPSYIILPILSYLAIKIYKDGKMLDIFYFALISILGDSVPAWIVFLSIEILVLLVALLLLNLNNIKNLLKYTKTSVYLIIAILAANAYTFVVTLAGFFYKAGGTFLVYGSPASKVITAKNESFFHLIDVIMFGQPKIYSFGVNPQNWTLLNITILLSAVAIFLYILAGSAIDGGKKLSFANPLSYCIYFIILLGVSLFLAKGFNPPFGNLYKYVILISPPGIVGITLDVEPWFIMAALSYSFLFSIGLYYAVRRLYSERPEIVQPLVNKVEGNSLGYFNKSYFAKSASFVIIVLLLGGAIASATVSTDTMLNNYTYISYNPIYYPQPYIEVSDYISIHNPNAYVTWIPYGGAYFWEKNYSIYNLITNLGGDISPNFVNPEYLYPYLSSNETKYLANLLTIGNVKYLILDESGISPINKSFNELFSFINEQTNIQLVFQSKWLYVFENVLSFSIIQATYYQYGSIPTNSNFSLQEKPNLNIKNIREVNPVQYAFNYYSSDQTLVIFHSPYSSMWELDFNGKIYRPISLYNGTETGFIIPKGYGQITIYYGLQTFFYIGSAISIAFLAIFLAYFTKRRKPKKRSQRN